MAMISQAAVSKLRELDARYFENHSLDDAGRKLDDVMAELRETLTLLDSLRGALHNAVCFTCAWVIQQKGEVTLLFL